MRIKKIRKRDGRIVDFDPNKITQAIWKAAQAVGGKDYERAKELSRQVVEILEKIQEENPEKIITVEEIQDVVEKVLVENGHYKTAKAYILYRKQHEEIRRVKDLFSNVEVVDNYLNQTDWRVRENSNMTYSLQGLNFHISSIITSQYWLNKIYPFEIREAHVNGDFHIHDLGILGAYCVGWDLRDLLMVGFKGVRGKIACKPAKHLRSALGQVINFFFTLQGEAAGAQALSNFDTYLAPFIRYDNLDYKQVKQALQEFVFNMNVPTRVGFQTPFTNITLDLEVPNFMKNEPVIIGGKPQKETYSDFQDEMDMFNKALAEVLSEGDAVGRVFTFPIPTYNITKDFDWDNDRHDPIWQMTAKYGIPYFANFINSDMKPEDVRSMCPLGGNEKVLIKSTRGRGLEFSSIRNIYEGNSSHNEYEIYSDGKFVKGKFNKFENQDMIKVTLANNHEVVMSTKHLNFVMRSPDSEVEELTGEELREGMYLPYSLNAYQGNGGNFDLGYFVGAFAGDGSLDRDIAVVFSLNKNEKLTVAKKLEEIAIKYFGANVTKSENGNLLVLRINSRAAAGLCKDFVEGSGKEKCYRARLFGMSLEFRKGVIKGHMDTNGGNRNRIYTSSKKMVETLNMLAATLGTTTSIYVDEREGRFGKEPNYAVLIYQLNRDNYGDWWFKKGDKLWVKIKSIEKLGKANAYCFEVENGEPMFTIGTTGILTHNCHLRLDKRELKKRGGGLFGANPLTGSIGVVTINMPRLGFLSQDEEEFFERLDKLMTLAKNSLEIKRKVLERLTENGLYPYAKFYLRNIKKAFGEYWKNHFSTIGLVGMNEACLNLLGCTIGDPEGQKFALKVLDFMRERLEDFQQETGNIYNLEATPAEGTSYRLARIDKRMHPAIIVANEDAVRKGAEPYYTNSTHLPVYFTDDLFEALRLQDPLQVKYTGGTVFHIFIGESMPSPEAVKSLIKKICYNFQLPYFTITPTFSICPIHGYMFGKHEFCPKCKEEGKETRCEVYSRIVGYLRPVDQWNDGKQEEFKQRKYYDKAFGK